MKYTLTLLIVALLMTTMSARLIDLSHNHGPDTMMSPHVPHFNRSTIFSGEYLPGVYVEGGQYFSGEHGGTHLDAPRHFQRDGQTVHEIPLENTIADGVMIDCSQEASRNRNYLVPLQKLLDWESLYGEIPMQAAVIFNFGWSSKFDNPAAYLGPNTDDQFKFEFPAVSAEAGIWLYDHRNIKIIASDTLTPDPFSMAGKPITSFPIHQRYLPNNRLIIENLKGTEHLPPRGFRFHASPVKYVGSTGTQVRAYAMTYDEGLMSGTPGRLPSDYYFYIMLIALYVLPVPGLF